MSQRVRVAVTGAAGQIGYALLFRLASGQVFGPDVDVELNLLEIEPALPALEGVVMELNDCAFKTLKGLRVTADAKEAMDGVNYAALIGSFPRKKGMERSDLLEKNGAIFKEQGAAINAAAASDVKILVVGNPCNTNALIAMHHAPDVPRSQFFAMTMLDQNRATAQLAMKAGVDVTDVSHMTIWGNHSATQYPDFYHARIKGRPVMDVIADEAWLQTTFIETVQQRGAAVIAARGASSAASAANGVVDGLSSLHHDTPAGDHYSMCCCSQGQYGVDEGLIFSFPCKTTSGVVEVVEGIEHAAFGQEKFQRTLDELREEKKAVQALGLIE
ncbi:MAG TPA: malate dehydrogenase [Coxiellaceae bacterium]|nr:malate dehydrogenase [Coxiellaceae bacterium]|tara:strand:- start:25 stop:1014 length:990 start_codon:yes stop_codon:yes gene_type:complete